MSDNPKTSAVENAVTVILCALMLIVGVEIGRCTPLPPKPQPPGDWIIERAPKPDPLKNEGNDN